MASLADMVRQNKMQSIPQDKLLGGLSSGLGAVRNFGNKVNVPYFGGMGDMFLGKSPEEIENWSYGNSPFQSTEMGLPQIKRERKQSLVDALSALTPMAKMTEGLPVGMSIKDISKNLNSDLLQKYLTTGKLSPKEMAQYEANGLAMETPNLQRYNVENAMANPKMEAYKNSLDFNWAHGSPSPNIQELVPSDIGAMGPGVYATNYFPEADRYATENIGATVYPLAVNTSKSFNPKKIGNIYDILNADNDRMLGQRLSAMDKDSIIQTQPPARAYYKHLNSDNLDMIPALPEREHYVTDYQDNIRSRFAAFDPLRKNSSSLLASLLGGTALVGQYNKEKKMKEMR